MSTAALGAATLDACLRAQAALGGGLSGFSRRFQKRLARLIDVPWMTVTGEDFRYAQAEGRRPVWIQALNWYTGRVYRLAQQDERVSRRFLQVMHLMKHPAVLFEPYVLRRVLTLMGTVDGLEFLINKLKESKSNSEFFDAMNT